MDIEFVVQDSYALTRPQWKFAVDLADAGKLFADAVAHNYKVQESEKAPEPEDDGDSSDSDDGMDEDGFPDAEDEDQSSSEEAEVPLTPVVSFLKAVTYSYIRPPWIMPMNPWTPNPRKKRFMSHARKKNAILNSRRSLTALLRR